MTAGNLADWHDIILISTADWDNPFWTNKQHVAAQLAERGHRVLYVESLGLRNATLAGRDLKRMARRLWRGLRGPREVRPNLWVLSPLALPLNRLPLARRLNRWLIPWRIKAASAGLNFRRPTVWTYNPTVIDWLDRLASSLVIYHCVDDLAAVPGVDQPSVRESENRLLARADLTFTTSSALLSRASAVCPTRAHYLPNVVDYDHFAQARETETIPADLAAIPTPRIGFVGALSDYKVDFDLISQLAAQHPDWQIVLIGQLGEGQPGSRQELCLPPNVYHLGPRPYGELPHYLGGMQAAILPMRLNSYTEAMFPMKFFEYLAAGLPVVSTALPALSEFHNCCRLTSGPEAFSAALTAVLAGDRPDPTLCDQAARRHSWNWRMDRMEEIIAQFLRRS